MKSPFWMIEPAGTPRAAAAGRAAVAACHRRSGVVVGRVLLAVPHLARCRARFQDPGAGAARGAVVLGQQRDARVGVVDAGVAPFGLGDLGRLPGERRRQRHHLVAEGHRVLEIAAVERLDPENGRRLIGPPAVAPRSCLDAGQRGALTRRLIRDLLRDLAAARPDFDVLREAVHRHRVGERLLDPGHQHVLPARRRRRGAQHRRLADRGLRPGCDIDRRKLAREVVVEQRVVVGGLEEILVGRGRRGLAVVLLDVRSGRHQRFGRRGAAARRHQPADHRGVVLQPVARIAGRGVDPIGAGDDRLARAGHAVGDPQLDAIVFGLQEGEVRPVGRELHVRDARLGGHLHRRLGAVADFLQRDRVDAGPGKAGRAVRSVGAWIHARAGEPVHRLGELGDRRIGARLRQRDHLLVGAEQRLRQRLGVECVDDGLRRQDVPGRIGCGRHLRLHSWPAVKGHRHENHDEQDEDVQEAARYASRHEWLLTADCNPWLHAPCALDRKMSWAGCESGLPTATASR